MRTRGYTTTRFRTRQVIKQIRCTSQTVTDQPLDTRSIFLVSVGMSYCLLDVQLLLFLYDDEMKRLWYTTTPINQSIDQQRMQ